MKLKPKGIIFLLILIVLFILFAIFYFQSRGYVSPKLEQTQNIPTSTIDLTGLWKTESGKIYKITQKGDSVVFTIYQLPADWKWQGSVGDTSAEGTLVGSKISGTVYVIPEKEYCIGYKWPHKYTATVSEDGKTINANEASNVYWRETCEETEVREKTEILTKIEQ